MSLEGKSAIITGSNSGIGLGTAALFASRGANVTVCGRDEERLKDAVNTCEQAAKDAGRKCKIISVQGNIADSTVIKKTVEDTVRAFGGLDILVANHGLCPPMKEKELEEWSAECFDRTFDVNVKSTIKLIQQAVPHLEKTSGNIVCVSSILSSSPINVSFDYQMSKATLDHMMRCLALQVGPKGIRINCVNSTYVTTRLARELGPMQSFADATIKTALREAPLKGAVSTPAEQAEVIAFLASDSARLVHGQNIVVDGGLTLKGQPTNFPQLLADVKPPQQ